MSRYTEQEARDLILSHYHVAFKIIWANVKHQEIWVYLKSLTMYTRLKTFSHFGPVGIYFAFAFNEEDNLERDINKFRNLFKNESPETFKEEVINGCHIFTI